MSFRMRPSLQEDLVTLVAFQLAMAAETEQLALERETVARGITRVLEEPHLGTYWSLLWQDELVGSCLALYEWSDWRAKKVLWLHSVYLKPKVRGLGLFRQAYQAFQTMVQDQEEWAGIRLYVDRRNTRAQAVYEGLGMSAEHYSLYEWMKEF